MAEAFIPYGAYWCTPFCKWQMSFSEVHAIELAVQAGRLAAKRKDLPLELLDFGVLGSTVPQRGAFYGLPWLAAEMGAPQITGPTISQACATSARILAQAKAAVSGGEAKAALAVATDRTSNGPHLYYPAPSAMGGAGEHEVWVLDNFNQDPWARCAMVETAENVAAECGITAQQQNEVVLHRHRQQAEALADGRAFQKRYMQPIELRDRNGRLLASVEADEGLREVDSEALAALKPFKPGGVVTSAAQTHPADGAAAVIVTNRALAAAFSLDPGVEIQVVAFGQHRERPAHMPVAPIGAARKALEAAGLSIADVAAIKSHNPFAINDIAFARAFNLDVAGLNNFGCSLVWGHPQGPTGLRAIIELIEELVLLGGGYGLFHGCAAGDSAMAAVVKVG